MVSLVELYNIEESTFERLHEIKSNRDPARGNKAKDREKDFYFVDEPADPETGRVTSKVVKKPSLSNMVKDLEAEIQDFEILVEDKPDDVVLYNISEELKEIYNTFRTHLRKNYPDEYKKVQEANVTGTGTSISTGNSPAFATPHAFAKKDKWKNKNTIYREQEEEELEGEEELSRDVKVLEKLLSDRINTKDEWIEMFELLIDHSEEISQINTSFLRSTLQQSMKEL
mgnify:CR=1 FL=1